MLGLARVMGETAPLLILGPYTASINTDLFNGHDGRAADDDQGRTSASRSRPAIDRLWASALTLILLVLAAQRRGPARRPVQQRPLTCRRPLTRPDSQRPPRPVRTDPMAQRIDVKDLNVFYGAFKAVEDVIDDDRGRAR